MKSKKSNHQREMESEMIRNVWKSWLYGLPVLLGFLSMAVSISLGAFIMGLTGVIMAVRKEMPSGRGTVRGTIAVVVGVLMTIMFWGAAIYFFFIEVLGWKL
ncbi:MAG: hypothetical protein KF758_16405 [Anaerolineales bacterium]|jgi:hypothetical protein|nr:hypothetical protein [Anaerolineales bacterium]